MTLLTELVELLWPREAITKLQADVATIRGTVLGIPARLTRLERLIMATAEDLAARIDAATTEVATDLQTIKDELATALADDDAGRQAAVDAALAKLDAPIARLEALGSDPANPVPDPEPSDNV